MTYLELIRDVDRKIDNGYITLGEYEKMTDIKEYLKQTKTVLLTQDAFDVLTSMKIAMIVVSMMSV